MTASAAVHAIDAVVSVHTPQTMSTRPAWARTFFGDKIGVEGSLVEGLTIDGYIAMMDEANIRRSFLFAQKAGPEWHPQSHRLDPRLVIDFVDRAPGRFSGMIGIDPTEGMKGVRELERAVREYGFIGAHAYPHWFGLPPNDRRWYPFYAKCCELDVPIQLQVGHCLVYSKERPLPSVGRPITLDDVACDLPELKIVGIHIGWPWTEEMMSVAYKHENVYIGSDAYAPKHWDPAFVRFIDSWGAHKVIFGSDFPVIDPRRAIREVGALGIRNESLRRLLHDNAAQLYGV